MNAEPCISSGNVEPLRAIGCPYDMLHFGDISRSQYRISI